MRKRVQAVAVVFLAASLAGCDKKVSDEGRAQILRAANTMADANAEWKKHAADLVTVKAEDAELFADVIKDFGAASQDYADAYGALVKGFAVRKKINDATIEKLRVDTKASAALAKRFTWICKRTKLKGGDEIEFAAWKAVVQNSLDAHAKSVALAWSEVEKVLPKKKEDAK